MYNPCHLFSNSLLTTAVLNITHTHKGISSPKKLYFRKLQVINWRKGREGRENR